MSLRRFTKNVPLPRLIQGSYLTIRSWIQQQQPSPTSESSSSSSSSLSVLPTGSTAQQTTHNNTNNNNDNSTSTDTMTMNHNNIPIHVIIEPSWRDTGHIELQQFFRTSLSSSTTSALDVEQQQQQQQQTIQMIVNQDQILDQPSKDRNAIVPHVTLDLILQQQRTCETATTTTITKSNSSSKNNNNNNNNESSDHNNNYFMKHISSLPKTTVSGVTMDRIMYDDGNPISLLDNNFSIDNDSVERKEHSTIALEVGTNTIVPSQDALSDTIGGTRTNYSDGIIHHVSAASDDTLEKSLLSSSSSSPSYVVLTIQVPEKLNLSCELLHSNNNNNNKERNANDMQYGMKNSIQVTSKLEGDVTLRCNGDIMVTKLRGHEIYLSTYEGGVIYASALLEAQRLSLQCTDSSSPSSTASGRIRAKQIHASHIDIAVNHQDSQSSKTNNEQEISSNPLDRIRIMDKEDDEGSLIDVSSMFVSGANGGAIISVNNNNTNNDNQNGINETVHPLILPRRAVRIKSHHGPVKVTTRHVSVPQTINPMTEELYPIVELGGVNGSCEVLVETSDQTFPIDEAWASCMIHVDSLAPESVSMVSSNHGDILLTLDRKTVADLRLASLSNPESIHEVGALLAEEDDNEYIVNILRHLEIADTTTGSGNERTKTEIETNDEMILMQTSAFTKRSETSFTNSNVSYVDGWVENKSSEPDSRFERRSRGLESVGKIRLDGAHEQALHSFATNNNNSGSGVDNKEDALRPLLAVVGTSQIQVETVSWIGAIARRYGLEEKGRELGRTASRKGRTFTPPKQ